MAPPTTLTLTMRPLAVADHAAVRALIEHDRIPGQPALTPDMLHDALAGRSCVDAGWWEALHTPRTAVACDAAGVVAGVVSYAASRHDQTGVLLWLHGREDPAVLGALIRHATTELGPRPVQAYAFASALGIGLEGLPVKHRAGTDAALRAAGFAGTDLWRYMHRTLPAAPASAHAAPTPGRVLISIHDNPDRAGWTLHLHSDDQVPGADRAPTGSRAGVEAAAEAQIGIPQAGIGVLWWIHVCDTHRGRGLGRILIGRVLAELQARGAREAILVVDDDQAPGGDRDRRPANRLYDSAGFTEIDRLHSYTRP